MSEQANEEKTHVQPGSGLQPSTGISVNGAQYQKTLNRLIEEGEITSEEAEVLHSVYSYAKEHGLSQSALAKKLDVSPAMVNGMLYGSYGASYAGIVKKCSAFIAAERRRIEEGGREFIRTWLYDQIEAICDSAVNDGMPAFIFGAPQSGKTTCLLHYQATHNHGRTKYLRLGSGWCKGRVVRELARACNVYTASMARLDVLEQRIIDALTSERCLIVDEFHQALVTTGENNSVSIMEYLREVHDRTSCGIVMCATPVGRELLWNGKDKKLFDQFRRRGLIEFATPDVPKVRDINTIAKSFKLEAPTGEMLKRIKQMLRESGLGKYIKYLRKANALATRRGEAVSWDGFEAVCEAYAAMAVPDNDY